MKGFLYRRASRWEGGYGKPKIKSCLHSRRTCCIMKLPMGQGFCV